MHLFKKVCQDGSIILVKERGLPNLDRSRQALPIFRPARSYLMSQSRFPLTGTFFGFHEISVWDGQPCSTERGRLRVLTDLNIFRTGSF